MSSSIIQRIGDLPGICFVLRKAASFLVAVTKSGHFFIIPVTKSGHFPKIPFLFALKFDKISPKHYLCAVFERVGAFYERFR